MMENKKLPVQLAFIFTLHVCIFYAHGTISNYRQAYTVTNTVHALQL